VLQLGTLLMVTITTVVNLATSSFLHFPKFFQILQYVFCFTLHVKAQTAFKYLMVSIGFMQRKMLWLQFFNNPF